MGFSITIDVIRRDGTTTRHFLQRPTLLFGRDRRRVDLWIKASLVSRVHGQINVHRDCITVQDKGSTNGSWYRGSRTELFEVRPGETFVAGAIRLKLISIQPRVEIFSPTPAPYELGFADTHPRLDAVTPIATTPGTTRETREECPAF